MLVSQPNKDRTIQEGMLKRMKAQNPEDMDLVLSVVIVMIT